MRKQALYASSARCLEGQCPEWAGYVVELFGIEIAEVDNPNDYPYSRMPIANKPKLLVQLFRARVAYEPRMVQCPLYLEIHIPGFGLKEASIKGAALNANASTPDLLYLLRARDFLSASDELNFRGFKSPRLSDKAAMFAQAAFRLGRRGRAFNILSLCKEAGNYRSRNSYYSFVRALSIEESAERAKRFVALIEEQYQLGLTQAQAPATDQQLPLQTRQI
jgi:hypothetical protein